MTPTELPGSPSLLRRINSNVILRTIRRERSISRTEISRSTGLSKPTVNEVVDRLLEAGYLTEHVDDAAAPRRPGPRPRLVRFRADLGYVLGVDVSHGKFLALIADLDGAVRGSARHDGSAGQLDRAALTAEFAATVAQAVDNAGIQRNRLRAAAIGTPGVVDPSGRLTLVPQLEAWEGVQLQQLLETVLPCPVHVENETRLALVAEQWQGAAQNATNALYVHIGYGIGAGILIDGQLVRGAHGAAGEIGLLPLPLSVGESGAPERLGPFEAAASGDAFARHGRRAASRPGGEQLLALAGNDPSLVDAKTIFAAAKLGDPVAGDILDELIGRLARGIAASVAVLDPELIVIGGGIARAGEDLLKPLKRKVDDLLPWPSRMELSDLGDDSVALGAMRIALDFADEQLFAELWMRSNGGEDGSTRAPKYAGLDVSDSIR